MNRLLASILLIGLGFAGGLTVTSRIRAAADAAPAPVTTTTAEPAPATTAPVAADAQRQTVPASVVAPGPDFTRVATAAVQGVANISSGQLVRKAITAGKASLGISATPKYYD